MRPVLLCRPATVDDVPFCVEAVIEAEKSRTDVLPYSTIFELTEDEARKMIHEIMLENIDGQDMAISSFYVLEYEGKPVGATATWLECADGVSSNQLKSDILRYYLPEHKITAAIPVLKRIQLLNFQREPNTVQIDGLFISEEFRSLENFLYLVENSLYFTLARYPGRNIPRSYGAFSEFNESLVRAVARIGYTLDQVIDLKDPEMLKYIPCLKRFITMKELIKKI
jgi:hypothetical protein